MNPLAPPSFRETRKPMAAKGKQSSRHDGTAPNRPVAQALRRVPAATGLNPLKADPTEASTKHHMGCGACRYESPAPVNRERRSPGGAIKLSPSSSVPPAPRPASAGPWPSGWRML